MTASLRITTIGEPTQHCRTIGRDVRTDQTERLCRAQHGCHRADACPLTLRFQSYDLGVLSNATFERAVSD